MNRHSELITTDAVSIETYINGTGPDVVILPSYGRDSAEDFDTFIIALTDAGYRVRGRSRAASHDRQAR